MSTPTSTPSPPIQAGSGRPRRRWWPFALAALILIVLVVAGTLAWMSFRGPLLGCAKASDPARSGAISEYCTPNYPPGDSMIAGPDGNIWFTDGNGKIARMTPQSGAVTEFAAPTSPNRVATSGLVRGVDGNIWYIANDTLGRITMSGQFKEFSLPQELGLARGIAAGSDGRFLWVSMSRNDPDPAQNMKLLKIAVPSDTTQVPQPTQVPLPANTSFGPSAAGPDSSLWMATGKDTITRITPSGSVGEFPLNTPGPAPSCGSECQAIIGLTEGPDGNMWFIDGWNHAGRITPTGATTFFPIQTSGWQYINVWMGAGPDGNMWFAPSAPTWGGIARITPAGAVTKFSLPHDGGSVSNITAGRDGGVWFLSWYPAGAFQSPQGRITRITP